MQTPAIRLITIPLALLLGSCSYTYQLRAVAIGGRLAFIVDPSSSHHPTCIWSISVAIDDNGPRATPAPGEDRAYVLNGGIYWQKDFAVGECLNSFPVFYGAPLKGVPVSYGVGSVEAKPLLRGFVYEVTTASPGSGYGGGWFRISKTGHIENLPSDPTPPHLLGESDEEANAK
jgi:hypothetical protein